MNVLSHVTLCLMAVICTLSESFENPRCISMPPPEGGSTIEIQVPSHIIHYSCNAGYQLRGSQKLSCINGTWSPPDPPTCEVMCTPKPTVLNGHVEYSLDGESSFPKAKGSMAAVVCDPGYSDSTFQTSYVIICGIHGLWTMPDGSLHLLPCTRKHCTTPPEVPEAMYKYSTYNPLMSEGLEVEYICSSGYELLDPDNARLICHNGQWEGPSPTCVLKAACATPSYIRNGKWRIMTQEEETNAGQRLLHGEEEVEYTKFEVGTEIEYSCENSYKLVGPKILQCRPTKIWSRAPPICIPESEHTWYCPDVVQIKNGFCKCLGENTADLQLCMPFHRGTAIECTCLQGYKLQGADVLTCIHSTSFNIGVWDWDTPRCYKQLDPESDMGMIPEGEHDGKSYNSGDISDGNNKVSSLVIVVTTACSVLGVLLFIMVIVVFRRKKPRAPLFQQGPAPPPYARVHNNSLDEHDRLALMAYADASRIHLPSYDEAMRPGGSHQVDGVPSGGMGHGASPSSEYRRLPSIHPAVRAVNLQHQQNVGGDGNNNINNNNNNNSNRHSTVTTSTMNRDGVSEIFGSLDTVNVSMSDASTSVTVETFDSGTSNRSMASQRATAGSLTSSDDQLVTDDAPLLDSSSQREVDVVSMSSNPSRTSKED